jgi:hypothetical protein
VNWNQVSADGAAEPEHPAPTLGIAAAPTAQAGTDEATGAGAQESPAASTAASTDDGSDVLPLAMSGAALVVSLLTALLVWRRGRPVDRAQDSSPRTLEGTRT